MHSRYLTSIRPVRSERDVDARCSKALNLIPECDQEDNIEEISYQILLEKIYVLTVYLDQVDREELQLQMQGLSSKQPEDTRYSKTLERFERQVNLL